MVWRVIIELRPKMGRYDNILASNIKGRTEMAPSQWWKALNPSSSIPYFEEITIDSLKSSTDDWQWNPKNEGNIRHDTLYRDGTSKWFSERLGAINNLIKIWYIWCALYENCDILMLYQAVIAWFLLHFYVVLTGNQKWIILKFAIFSSY